MARFTLLSILALSILSFTQAAHIKPQHREHAVAVKAATHTRQRRCSARRGANGTTTSGAAKASSTAHASTASTASTSNAASSGSGSDCFPALGFKMPGAVPSSTDGWWCDASTEYAFLGFSYEITACQSSSQLNKEFADIRNRFNGRYVRLYGACDQEGYYRYGRYGDDTA